MDKEKFQLAQQKANLAEAHVKELLPAVAAARTRYFKFPTDENKAALEEIEREAAIRLKAFTDVGSEMEEALGITAEMLASEAEEAAPLPWDHIELPRRSLTAGQVKVTGDIPSALPDALNILKSLVPKDWLNQESRDLCRLGNLRSMGSFISLTKGMRSASEETGVHKLRQAIFLAEDLLNGHPDFDHFAGSMLLAELAQLSFQYENVKQSVVLTGAIDVGHKIARTDLSDGEKVIKYGAPIGSVTKNTERGAHVHMHNMKSDYIKSHTRDLASHGK